MFSFFLSLNIGQRDILHQVQFCFTISNLASVDIYDNNE